MEVVNEVCLVLQGLHTNDKIMEKFPYLEEKNNGKKILKTISDVKSKEACPPFKTTSFLKPITSIDLQNIRWCRHVNQCPHFCFRGRLVLYFRSKFFLTQLRWERGDKIKLTTLT